MDATTHERVREAFSAYVDGDVEPERRKAIEEHLASCLQCRTHLEQFRATLGRLGGLRERAPRSFLPESSARSTFARRGGFFTRRWLLFGRIPFEWVSMLMIVSMLVYYIVTSHSAPTQVTPGP